MTQEEKNTIMNVRITEIDSTKGEQSQLTDVTNNVINKNRSDGTMFACT